MSRTIQAISVAVLSIGLSTGANADVWVNKFNSFYAQHGNGVTCSIWTKEIFESKELYIWIIDNQKQGLLGAKEIDISVRGSASTKTLLRFIDINRIEIKNIYYSATKCADGRYATQIRLSCKSCSCEFEAIDSRLAGSMAICNQKLSNGSGNSTVWTIGFDDPSSAMQGVNLFKRIFSERKK